MLRTLLNTVRASRLYKRGFCLVEGSFPSLPYNRFTLGIAPLHWGRRAVASARYGRGNYHRVCVCAFGLELTGEMVARTLTCVTPFCTSSATRSGRRGSISSRKASDTYVSGRNCRARSARRSKGIAQRGSRAPCANNTSACFFSISVSPPTRAPILPQARRWRWGSVRSQSAARY